MLSVIIPTYNAARTLPATLNALRPGDNEGLVGETIVVDGGSTDGTTTVAESWGARVLTSAPGRGRQLAAGGAAANGPWFLFLHADTRLDTGWPETVAGFIDSRENNERAAVFRYRLDDDSPAARRLEAIVDWRTRVLGLPYGDQGLLIHRDFYAALGGFKPLPLMEDVDMIRRIGKARFTVLDVPAVTSAARYAKGYWRRTTRNVFCLSLYFLGVPPRFVARIYR